MKSFKLFLESKEKESEEAGTIPAPIHFKHIPAVIPEVETKKGVIPSPISFKGEYTWDEPQLKEAKKEIPRIDNWHNENDNAHFSKHGVKSNAGLSTFLSKGKKTTEDEDDSLRLYAGKHSTELNQNLLKNKKLKDWHKEVINDIDAHIDRNNMKHELHVYSGLGFDPEKHMKKKKLYSPCYISTTHDKKVALKFSNANKPDKRKNIQHVAHIHLKPGDPATHVHKFSEYEEHETLIKKGVTLKHHGYTDYHDNLRLKKLTAGEKKHISNFKHQSDIEAAMREGTGDVVRVHHFTLE